MSYARPSHSSKFRDGSATDGTVLVGALADGLEAVEEKLDGSTEFGLGLLTPTDAAAARVLLSAQRARTFDIRDYGTVDLTGTNDSSTALSAVLTACYAAGGGVIDFPAGKMRFDTFPRIPNTGGSTPTQPTITFRGLGAAGDAAYGNLGTSGATIFDIRDATKTAKIETLGVGLLGIENLVLTCTTASDGLPFVKTTATTLAVKNVGIYGDSSKTGTACDQDGFQFGNNTTGHVINGDPSTASFHGYGTTIENVTFGHIRRVIYGRTSTNALSVRSLTIGISCGAGSTTGAIHLDGSGDQARANQFSHILVEATNYAYVLYLVNATSNTFTGVQVWDGASAYVAHETGTSTGNFVDGYFSPSKLTDTALGIAGRTADTWLGNLGQVQTVVRPTTVPDAPNKSDIFSVRRSLSEGTDPNAAILTVNYAASASLNAPTGYSPVLTLIHKSSGQLTIDQTSLVRDSGHLNLYAGTGAQDRVRIVRGLFDFPAKATASRPAANSVQAGTCYYDTTVSKPVWSDGTTWRDAAGNAV